MGRFKELLAYKAAFDLCMDIFEVSKSFPDDEKFGLTSQMRRSSRSVCSNIAEGYRKRRYTAHFTSKMTDADMENAETMVWIDVAYGCHYIDEGIMKRWLKRTVEIEKLLAYMITNPAKFS